VGGTILIGNTEAVGDKISVTVTYLIDHIYHTSDTVASFCVRWKTVLDR